MTVTWHCRECDATGTTDAGAARHTLTTTHGTVTHEREAADGLV